MKNLLRVLLVVVFLATVAVQPVLAKTSWNANSVWPPKNLHSVGLGDFAEKVKNQENIQTACFPQKKSKRLRLAGLI